MYDKVLYDICPSHEHQRSFSFPSFFHLILLYPHLLFFRFSIRIVLDYISLYAHQWGRRERQMEWFEKESFDEFNTE